MTQHEIELERIEWRRVMCDPTHPRYETQRIFETVYVGASDKTREFMRKIAPYAFDADELKTPKVS